MSKLSSAARDKLSNNDFAYIDDKGGKHLPIHDAAHVRNALARFSETKFEDDEDKQRARKKIEAAAKKFGVEVNNATDLRGVVCMEFDPESAVLALEGDENPNGIMKLRVPFYVGDSVARPSNWMEPLYFSSEELPGIVAEGNAQVNSGEVPLTVYARHSHAANADQLPIGRVVGLESDGKLGYALLEVVDDGGFGTQVQRLVGARMLNSVSLRSKPGFLLDEVRVNGEVMSSPKGLRLAGIDFAPDGGAMRTTGLQVLAESPVIEPYTTPPDKEEPENMDLTLETLRADHAAIVAEVEKPLRDMVAELEAKLAVETAATASLRLERDSMVAEKEVGTAIDELAGRAGDPVAARALLAEACKDAKSRVDVFVTAAPLMAEVAATLRTPPVAPPAGDTKTAGQLFAEAFGTVPDGRGRPAAPPAPTRNVEYAGGLPLPE